MAKVDMKMPEEFLLKLSQLGEETDKISAHVLKAGGKVVEAKVKSNLQSIIGNSIKTESRSTGELLTALGVSSAKQDKDGNFNVKVGFSEPRKDGKSNAMVAGILEYGKHGQLPKPFLKPARLSSKKDCVDAMVSAFEEEVQKI